jgi:hypothetical protein
VDEIAHPHPFNWILRSFEKVLLNGVDDPWCRRSHWSDVKAQIARRFVSYAEQAKRVAQVVMVRNHRPRQLRAYR